MHSCKKIIINLAQVETQVQQVKNLLGGTDISVYDTMEAYLGDGHMLMDTTILTWKDLFYEDYMNKKEMVYVVTDMGKRQFRKYAKKILDGQFYPIKMFRINPADSKEKITATLQHYKENDRRTFFRQYFDLLKSATQQESTPYDTAVKHIVQCPYCKGDSFKIYNEVEELEKNGKNIDECYGWFYEHLECTECHEKIMSTPIMIQCLPISDYTSFSNQKET